MPSRHLTLSDITKLRAAAPRQLEREQLIRKVASVFVSKSYKGAGNCVITGHRHGNRNPGRMKGGKQGNGRDNRSRRRGSEPAALSTFGKLIAFLTQVHLIKNRWKEKCVNTQTQTVYHPAATAEAAHKYQNRQIISLGL